MGNTTSESKFNVKPELNRQMFQSQIQESLPRFMYNKNKCPGEELPLTTSYYLHFIFNNSIEIACYY